MKKVKQITLTLLPQPAPQSGDSENKPSPTAVSYTVAASSKAPSLSDLASDVRIKLLEELSVDSYWLPEYQCYGNKVPILTDASLSEALSYFAEQQQQQQPAAAGASAGAAALPAATAAAACELYLWPTAAAPPWTLADYFAATGKQLGFNTGPQQPAQGLTQHDTSAGLKPATTAPCDDVSHRNDSSSSGSTAATAAAVHSGTTISQQHQQLGVEMSVSPTVQPSALQHDVKVVSPRIHAFPPQTPVAVPAAVPAAAAAAGTLFTAALLPVQTPAGLLLLPIAYQQPAVAAVHLGKRPLAAAISQQQQQQKQQRPLKQPKLQKPVAAPTAVVALVGRSADPCGSSVSNSSSDSLEMLQLDLAPSIGQGTAAAAAAVSPTAGSPKQQEYQQGLSTPHVGTAVAAAATPVHPAGAAATAPSPAAADVFAAGDDAFGDLYTVLMGSDPDHGSSTDLIQGSADACKDTWKQQQQHKETVAAINPSKGDHTLYETLDPDFDLDLGFLSDHSDCPEFDHSDLGCDLKDIWDHWRWE